MYDICLDLGARASCAHFTVFKICIMGYNDAYRRLSSPNVIIDSVDLPQKQVVGEDSLEQRKDTEIASKVI